MKRTYEVIWAETAEKDLISIIDYIATDAPSIAVEKLKEIKSKTSNLYTYASQSRIVPELQEQGIIQYRELIVAPWRIIYRISQKRVYVLSVLDSRRNVEDILLQRFVNQK